MRSKSRRARGIGVSISPRDRRSASGTENATRQPMDASHPAGRKLTFHRCEDRPEACTCGRCGAFQRH